MHHRKTPYNACCKIVKGRWTCLYQIIELSLKTISLSIIVCLNDTIQNYMGKINRFVPDNRTNYEKYQFADNNLIIGKLIVFVACSIIWYEKVHLSHIILHCGSFKYAPYGVSLRCVKLTRSVWISI